MREVYIPDADIHAALDGAAPVGFVALLGPFVGGLFVAPERHGQGVGRALVEHAACLRGALDVDVYEENHAARRFYDRLGFAETARRGEDDRGRPFAVVSMRREIPQPASARAVANQPTCGGARAPTSRAERWPPACTPSGPEHGPHGAVGTPEPQAKASLAGGVRVGKGLSGGAEASRARPEALPAGGARSRQDACGPPGHRLRCACTAPAAGSHAF